MKISTYIVALSFLCSITSYGQSVLDMYLEIPASRLGQLGSPDSKPATSSAAKKKLLKTIDIKNGFLETHSRVQIVKFKSKLYGSILAVAGGSYAEDGRTKRIEFFSKSKIGVWVEVTNTLFTPIPDLVIDAIDTLKCGSRTNLSDSGSGSYRYLLPRKGRVIRAVVESERAKSCKVDLFTMSFDGIKLSMKI